MSAPFSQLNTLTRFVVILCVLSFVSCKMEKKEGENIEIDENISTKNKIDSKDFFQVEMNLVVHKDDKFQLFYNEFNDEGFSQDRVITVMISGSKDQQRVSFDLPKEVFPTEFRLDFGENPNQDPIKLNDLTISFDQREYRLTEANFLDRLKPNKFVTFNELEQTIVTQKIDEVYDPYFVSKDLDQIFYQLMN